MAAGPAGTLGCTVELFGMARVAAGTKAVSLGLVPGATLAEVASQLARVCPELVGKALRPGGRGLMDGWVFNLNGRSFVNDLDTSVAPGIAILLLSDQAGG